MIDKPNEYTIQCVNDFLNVPEERIDACLMDFKQYISLSRAVSAMTLPDGLRHAPEKCRFVWVDDGENVMREMRIEFGGTP